MLESWSCFCFCFVFLLFSAASVSELNHLMEVFDKSWSWHEASSRGLWPTIGRTVRHREGKQPAVSKCWSAYEMQSAKELQSPFRTWLYTKILVSWLQWFASINTYLAVICIEARFTRPSIACWEYPQKLSWSLLQGWIYSVFSALFLDHSQWNQRCLYSCPD